ncbi:uncharacterized protein [Clytia hemisphaerica]|uniref:uncharacterized protein n=1 Tax=Clytia hemisphaerica TaxID=252671 RepID=UPI0034D6CA65
MLAGINETPKKVLKREDRELHKHCIICGVNISIQGRRYVTLATQIRETLNEIIDISQFSNLCRVCNLCKSKAESVKGYIKRYEESKKTLIEKFKNTQQSSTTGVITVKRLAKSQSPGRSPSSSSSTITSRKRLRMDLNNVKDTPIHPQSRKKISLPTPLASSEKENLIPVNIMGNTVTEPSTKKTYGKSIGYKQVKVTVQTVESGATKTRILNNMEAIVVKLIALKMQKEAVMTLIKLPEYKDHLTECFIKLCLEELTDISSISTNSILTRTDAKSIKNLGVASVMEEFSKKIPTLTKVIFKITKDDTFSTTQICNAVVSSHNQKLSALRHKNGLFFRQCGLLRKGQEVLSKMKMSTHPTVIRKKLVEMGNDHDSKVLEWKKEKEDAVKKGECGVSLQFIGDNLDAEVNPSHQTLTNKNKSFHWFNMFAIKEKVNGSHLSNVRTREMKDVAPEEFLPTKQDLKKVEKEFIIIAARILVKYIPSMSVFKDVIVHHIDHQYSEEMAKKSEQIPLGTYALNENRHEDMMEIIERIQERYGIQDETGKSFTFFGGDQLTEERSRTVQFARADGRTVEERLQGIIPKFEDWHAIRTGYESALKIFFNKESTADAGTYLSNAISKLFVIFVVLSGVDSIEDYHPPLELETKDLATKRRWLHGRIHLFLKNNVMGSLEMLTKMLPEQKTHKCRDKKCTKRFFFLPAKNMHEEIEHGLPPLTNLEETSKEVADDDLYNYSCSRVCVGLLLLNANDAVKEGDGDRLMRFYRIYTFIFRMNGNHKYAYICLRLKARELALLSAREYHRLKWNRFVNNEGGRGKNISLDLRLEHINKVTKALIKSQGMQNVTDESVESISKAIGGMEELVESQLLDAGITKRSSHHSNKHKHDIFLH